MRDTRAGRAAAGPVVALLLVGLLAAACSSHQSGAGDTASATVDARASASSSRSAEAPRMLDVPQPAGRPFRLAAVGDIACGADRVPRPDICHQADTAALARSRHPDAVITLGDLQYETGSTRDFQASYDKSWGTLKAKTRPVAGNHEYITKNAAGYFSYFPGIKPWYAWDAGSWRFYMLNSNCGSVDCAAENRWLQADLTAHPRKCSAIAIHSPRFSSGSEHGSDPSMTRFWSTAYKAGVDLALAGHDHDYERFVALDPSGRRDPKGLVSFVSGTGGRSLYKGGPRQPGSAYFQNKHYGVLMLQLKPAGFDWAYRTIEGAVPDSGSATCH